MMVGNNYKFIKQVAFFRKRKAIHEPTTADCGQQHQLILFAFDLNKFTVNEILININEFCCHIIIENM